MRIDVAATILLMLAGLTARAQEKLQLVPQLGMGEVRAVAFSPDGGEVLTATGNVAWLWDAASGEQLRAFKGHAYDVNCVAFSPDGHFVLTGSKDSSVRLWDAVTGQQIRSFDYEAEVWSVAFSPDGQFILVGGESATARLWDVATQRETSYPGVIMSVEAVAFSPDGRYILIGYLDNRTVLLDRATGRELRWFNGQTTAAAGGRHAPRGGPFRPSMGRLAHLDTHHLWVTSEAFSPDGRLVLTGNNEEGALLWDRKTGEKICTFLPHIAGFGGGVLSAVFSPDGKFVLTATGDETAQLWNVATGEHLMDFSGDRAVFSPDGRFVLTGGKNHTASLWEVATGSRIRVFQGHTQPVSAVSFSPDGYKIVTDVGGTVRLWDTGSGQQTQWLAPNGFSIPSMAFSPDGHLLVSASNLQMAELWDETSGKLLRSINAEDQLNVSQDGRFVLTSSIKTGAVLWDAATGRKLHAYSRKPESFTSLGFSSPTFQRVAFSPDGSNLLSTTNDNPRTDVWNVATGKFVHELNAWSGDVYAVAYSPDGRLALTGNMHNTALQWNPNTGQQLRSFSGHTGPVDAVAFSPDRDYRYVLTGSWDCTARLWDRASGQSLHVFEGHRDWVTSVTLSPDGRFVLTGSTDTTAKLWDAATGKELATLLSLEKGGWAVVDPAGRFDTSDLDGGAPLAWVVSSEPMRALPLEIFMRDYYTPRLLSRIMNGESLPPIRPISVIKNRVQPDVSIVSVAASKTHAGRVDVVVHAASHTDEKGQASGLQDLRLFRNGQMVGYLAGALKDGDFIFPNIQLPTSAKSVAFTSYAFNSERIKSVTAQKDYAYEPGPAAKPRAWLLQIGVNHYRASGCELHDSANDAEQLSKILTDRLTARGLGVKAVKLVSTDQVDNATKEKIHSALVAIAASATPDDVFFLSFSGHGYSNQRGQFYILPSDVQGTCAGVDNQLLGSAISADELTEWLRSIDAGEMTFILDSCDSASGVESNNFKPGPMGSPGLGQLAYDKRMRILAASQPNQAARESDGLHHGLLSYALTEEGLVEGKADWRPVDQKITVGEWLGYAADAVPKLLQAGAVRSPRGLIPIGEPMPSVKSVQTPAVFDFSKKDLFVLQ